MVLENIKNNVELDTNPSGMIKAKGAEQKCTMESMDSHIPKKAKKEGWTEKHCMLCKTHGGLTRATVLVTAAVTTRTELL